MNISKIKYNSCNFLCFVIAKYRDQLPYNARLVSFAKMNLYSTVMINHWYSRKIHPRIWILLEKDLEIARLKQQLTKRKDKEKILTLEELYQEFQSIKK